MPIRPERFSRDRRRAGWALATALLVSLVPGTTLAGLPSRPVDSAPRWLTTGPGGVWFTADDGVTGRELYRTDGTEGGTVLVADINPSGSSKPEHLRAWKGWMYFTADDGSHGIELWRSDGTTTELVLDIRANNQSSTPDELTPMGDWLYFAATNARGRELWRTNGKASGTTMVKDIDPAGYGIPQGLRVLKGRLIFFARDGAGGMEPWRSDGTARGTVRIKNIVPGPGGSIADFEVGPRGPIVSGGRVFFWASDASHGRELWATNGTAAGTYLVKDIAKGSAGSDGRFLVRLGTGVMFEATTTRNGAEPWVSSGAKGDASMVRDMEPGAADGLFTWPATKGSTVYFARHDIYGDLLYRTNGTKAGTVQFKDLYNRDDAEQLRWLAGRLWFVADGTGSGRPAVWTSTGTDASTVKLLSETSHGGTVDPSEFSMAELGAGVMVYPARDDTHGIELWKTGGTPETTTMIRNIAGAPDH